MPVVVSGYLNPSFLSSPHSPLPQSSPLIRPIRSITTDSKPLIHFILRYLEIATPTFEIRRLISPQYEQHDPPQSGSIRPIFDWISTICGHQGFRRLRGREELATLYSESVTAGQETCFRRSYGSCTSELSTTSACGQSEAVYRVGAHSP